VKYDIDIDPSEVNTSHAVIIDMVGTGKRVLDVGCATGYLAKRLKERDNTVVGIEIDPEAAALAEPWMERCVVGDLEQLDLEETFGTERFDIIVFADVLEHLSDPIVVLQAVQALLGSGGSVVVSIPNVAHGAVRLALLQGRFDYRPLGILDDTHLRFFTRETLEDFLGAAGLVAVDRRRTTAGVFATEIPLDARQFSPEVIDDVQRDPDSTTYQFVVRAIPIEQSKANRALAAELARRDQQLRVLQSQVESMVGEVGAMQPGPAVGIVTGTRLGQLGVLDSLGVAALTAELRRRLGGFATHIFAAGATEPSVYWTGEPVCPLGPWSPGQGAEMAADVDAVVVCGDPPPEDLTDELKQAGCPLFFVGDAASGGESRTSAGDTSTPLRLIVGGPPDDRVQPSDLRLVPDVAVLAARLHAPAMLERRRDYLRLIGQLPGDPYAVVALWETPETSAAAIARSLDELARRATARLVILTDQLPPGRLAFAELLQSGHAVFATTDPADVLALIAGSQFGVTDSASLLALAAALHRPYQGLSSSSAPSLADLAGWLADPDVIADRPAALLGGANLAEARAADPRILDRLTDTLDLALDDLADRIHATLGRRAATSVPSRLRDMVQRIAVLEAANRGLQQRMAEERAAFGSQARELLARGGVMSGTDPNAESAAEAELRVVRFKYEQARKELETLYATKTMRMLKPAREVYARLRTMRR
jgi:2-polyprenyl-3-methyl-5-hydroxy-6-metoxy-1,4-benzoquinol methylase